MEKGCGERKSRFFKENAHDGAPLSEQASPPLSSVPMACGVLQDQMVAWRESVMWFTGLPGAGRSQKRGPGNLSPPLWWGAAPTGKTWSESARSSGIEDLKKGCHQLLSSEHPLSAECSGQPVESWARMGSCSRYRL